MKKNLFLFYKIYEIVFKTILKQKIVFTNNYQSPLTHLFSHTHGFLVFVKHVKNLNLNFSKKMVKR